MKPVRVVVETDLHSGHEFALTHPDFDSQPHDTGCARYENWLIRRRMYAWYSETLERLQPIDILFNLGDNVDGKGQASDGTELILPKLSEQVDCASACIEQAKANDVYMVYGTDYHDGKDSCGDLIAKNVKAVKIGDHDYLKVNNTVFDYAHHVGNSQLPHTRFTPIARERLNNLLWAEHDEYPKADVILRGHVHYCVIAAEPDGWLAMTCPGLQLSSRFGRSRIRTVIHFGLTWFDVDDAAFQYPTVELRRLHSARKELMVYSPKEQDRNGE